jgi:cytochrome c553
MIEPGAQSIHERTERARRRVMCAGLAVLCAFITFHSYRILAQRSPSSSATTLTAQEQRGKAIYQRGVSSSGREIFALMGEIEVPASVLTCAGCHGAKGE